VARRSTLKLFEFGERNTLATIYPLAKIGIGTKDISMSNISISLPDDVKAYIDEQIAKAGYASASEYFVALVQREQRQNQAQAA